MPNGQAIKIKKREFRVLTAPPVVLAAYLDIHLQS